jgi:hypothetical protein
VVPRGMEAIEEQEIHRWPAHRSSSGLLIAVVVACSSGGGGGDPHRRCIGGIDAEVHLCYSHLPARALQESSNSFIMAKRERDSLKTSMVSKTKRERKGS